jgi:hypothetical protein
VFTDICPITMSPGETNRLPLITRGVQFGHHVRIRSAKQV